MDYNENAIIEEIEANKIQLKCPRCGSWDTIEGMVGNGLGVWAVQRCNHCGYRC